MTRARAAIVAALLAAAFAVHYRFLVAYPQPILFGDPAGYLTVGQRLLEALRGWWAGQPPAVAFESVRLLLPLLGVGSLFAVLEALRPGDLAFFRTAMALVNTAGMLGAFLLARRLSGTFAGGIAALILAALHPTYSVQTGRLYPDPVTGCLFVWSAWLWVEGLERWRARWFLGAGFALTAGLFVRSQFLEFIPALAATALLATAPRWWRVPGARRMVAALVLGALPILAGWMAIQRAVGGNLDAVDQLGNFTFRQRYPYGFWQFLETDGWIGPYRLKAEPYYQALQKAAEGDPDLLRNRRRQLAFTARYVSSRPVESTLLVLDNAYRLHDRPPNDYKWDYPYPYAAQVIVHRALCVLAVAAFALFTAERPARAGAFLIPVALTVLHGLAFPWPRYAQPGLFIVIAAAGALLGWIGARWRALPDARARATPWGRAGMLAAASIAAAVVALALVDLLPRAAHLLRVASVLAVAAVPFALAAALSLTPAARRLLTAGLAVLVVLVTAHAVRDRRWHEARTRIGRHAAGIEQEIALTPEARGRLRAASEAFVVFDLEVPAGDRFSDQGRVYEGPSFGDWPRFVALKLEYDGDYRLAVRETLGSADTRSFVLEPDGERRPIRGVHRVRVITVGQNEGWTEWETAPATSSPGAFAWAAWAGARGEAELAMDRRPLLRFPLGATWNFESEGAGYRLCFRSEGIRGEKPYGVYVLSGPAEVGRPAALRVRFRTGMGHDPLFYVVDARRTLAGGTSADACQAGSATPGAARILNATKNNYPEDTGRWTVTGVF